jgi:peptidoglycan/LPS O-acetylase OafA/YrhL
MSTMSSRKPWAVAVIVRALLPSFIADLVWPDLKPIHKLHPTSYLDGLRGIAAFIVVIYHYTEVNHGYFAPTYGLNGGKPSSFMQLPFIRMIYCGRPMVHIFFVISGFVLSYKPLKLILQGDLEKCYTTLASSTFRRPIRLFLPCVISTFIVAVMMELHLVYQPMPAPWIWTWITAMIYKVCWPWNWDDTAFLPYDGHLWTIAIEFNHSMLLFLGIMCMSRLRLFIRQVMVVAIMVYGIACGKWATFEFFGGMLLAEMHVLRRTLRSDVYNFLEDSRWTRQVTRPTVRTVFHISTMIVGFYIGGWPNMDVDKTWGLSFLNHITPSSFQGGDAPQRLWFAISAFFITWACGELSWIRRFLEGPLAQYCGRLSYAIYIVHGPALELCQARVVGLPHVPQKGQPGEEGFVAAIHGFGIKGIFGHDTTTQQFLSWLVALVILFPYVVWLSDIFWRLVDLPITAFGRTLENMCLDPSPNESKEREGYTLA